MIYCRYSPPPPLSCYVSCIWYSEGFEGTHSRERLLPNGESGIVFDLRENPSRLLEPNASTESELYAPSVFCGSRTDYFILETNQQERVIGIQFKPGGAIPFLDMPASEVAHSSFSLADIWPVEAGLLREQLLAAPDVKTKIDILQCELLHRLLRPGRRSRQRPGFAFTPHPAITFAIQRLQSPGAAVRLSDLANHVGLSSRRFIELFQVHTGLSPKAFQRVRRFQYVLQKLRPKPEVSWAELALDCGYFDQSHFIHDFRQFAGLSPTKYLMLATPHLNHLPID